MPRVRTRGPQTSTVNQVSGSIVIPTKPWPVGDGGPIVSSYSYEQMVDSPTPGFERIRNDGGIVVTAMSSLKETMQLTPCQYRVAGAPYTLPGETGEWRNGFAIINHDGGTAQWLVPKDVSDEQARTRERLKSAASVQALASVAEPDVESMVSVAEARETLSFLASPFASAIKLGRQYRRYVDTCERLTQRFAERMARWNKRNPKYRGEPPVLKLPKWTVGKFTAFDIPSAWLALRYGLMPIYYDIQGIMEAASKTLDKPVRKTYRAKREETGKASVPRANYQGSFGETYDMQSTVDWIVTVRAGCVAEFKADFNQVWGTHYSLVPSAAWEMVTLSFAVDWIVNVGDFLKALTVSARADIKGSWVTSIIDTQMTSRTTGIAAPNTLLELQPTPVCQRTYVDKRRDIDIGQFVRVVRDVNMNLSRYADLASLFALLVFGKNRR